MLHLQHENQKQLSDGITDFNTNFCLEKNSEANFCCINQGCMLLTWEKEMMLYDDPAIEIKQGKSTLRQSLNIDTDRIRQ